MDYAASKWAGKVPYLLRLKCSMYQSLKMLSAVGG